MLNRMATKNSKLKISKGKYSVYDLLDRAKKCQENYDYDMAKRYCKRAIEMEPDNVEVLENIGSIFMDFGDWDSAKEIFERCVNLSPETGYQKYMYLGQVNVAEDAVNLYNKGIEIMIKELNNLPENSEKSNELRRKISSALCSIVEMYMTDLCDEPNAEENCEKYITEAEKYCNTNFEVYQTMASVRMSQNRQDEAKELIIKSINLWKDLSVEDENYPEYPIRVNLAKLMLELHMNTEALSLLQSLLQEDDEIVEVSYLCGWCYYLLGEEPDENGKIDETVRKEAWEDARLCFINLINRFGLSSPDDQSVLNHSIELKNKITSIIGEISNAPEPTVEINDDDWEDIDNEMDLE
ncbi:TPR-like protein [Neocallimastix lanati (nom. inval.)]|uniref:TPR-like protein n=1 Tax=Neocallimastix californiae TaxID=1754190 RepID=A0A1Y2DIB1_9FUNG|nr:TPR-like protein [Neocallimastix sp. JGI-2020a]ORY58968.1 TPR-like protein [Neocallimastix californiae]|eukprot:ORY58968.1 TPR-like protein [Neocallimastix californiae]